MTTIEGNEMAQAYKEAANKKVSSANGIDYTYREVGTGNVPLVLLQHFRGNLDNWDPALIDSLAEERRVIAFDNAGVGGSSGPTPNNFEQMAHDAIAYATAMGLEQVDLLGYSIGSFVAQEMALIRPDLVRKVVRAQRGNRYAWLGAGGHRSGREARHRPRRLPEGVLH
jgi:pimeloyl-ACP methyl ester carboxylesterase